MGFAICASHSSEWSLDAMNPEPGWPGCASGTTGRFVSQPTTLPMKPTWPLVPSIRPVLAPPRRTSFSINKDLILVQASSAPFCYPELPIVQKWSKPLTLKGHIGAPPHLVKPGQKENRAKTLRWTHTKDGDLDGLMLTRGVLVSCSSPGIVAFGYGCVLTLALAN